MIHFASRKNSNTEKTSFYKIFIYFNHLQEVCKISTKYPEKIKTQFLPSCDLFPLKEIEKYIRKNSIIF